MRVRVVRRWLFNQAINLADCAGLATDMYPLFKILGLLFSMVARRAGTTAK